MFTSQFRHLFLHFTPFLFSLGAIFTFISSNKALGQKAFVGRLEYHIKMENPQFSKDQQVDTMVIYTNDTIVRIESKSKLGEQVLIKHLVKQKSYLLLNVNDQKFAIQTNADTALTKNTIDQKIKYYWFGSKKISGVKAKKAKISRNDLDTAKIFYYTKTIRPDLLNVYEGVKGLPLHYYLQHTDGIYQYQLVEFSDQAVSRDLFGIPSDYKITTFDEFLKAIKQE